jgi:hypothetical protein
MAKRRAQVVSTRDLSKSVDKAVALAVKRHKVKTATSNLVLNWEIIGRLLRDVTDVNVAFQFASDVTKGVQLQGVSAQPALAKLDRDILVGFIERARLPRQIGP